MTITIPGGTTKIDRADNDLLLAHFWYVDSSTGYVKSRKPNGGTQYLHRLILERVVQHAPRYSDHANRKKLDNRRSNLREVTNSENMLNCTIRSTNTSGHTGVARFRNKWRAYITLLGKQKHLGYFPSKRLAAEARKKYQW